MKTVISNSLPEDAKMIRQAVFVEEQGFQNEFDAYDQKDTTIHLVLYDEKQPIATARILDNGHIGRIAVMKEYRGKHIGSLILDEAEKEASKYFDVLKLSAQQQAIPFYEKNGYTVCGEMYYDEHCPHFDMIKKL